MATVAAIAAAVSAATGVASLSDARSARKKTEQEARNTMAEQMEKDSKLKKQQEGQASLAEQRAKRRMSSGGRQGTVLAGYNTEPMGGTGKTLLGA